MRIIPMQAQHLDQVVALVLSTGYNYYLDRDWLRYRTLQDPQAEAGWSLLALEGERVIGCCLATLTQGKGLLKLLAVAPDRQRQGVATALVAALESVARLAGCIEIQVGVLGPGYFLPGVPIAATPMVSFLLHRDYETDRAARVNMDVDLEGAVFDVAADIQRLGRQGITVRRATPEDVTITSAFAREHFSEGWATEVTQGSRHEPRTLFVALKDDTIVAFAVHDATGRDEFGPTGTHPDYRRRGIGSVLLKMCLRNIQARGGQRCTIIWAGPIGYYASAVGAYTTDAYWQWHKRLVEGPAEGPAEEPAKDEPEQGAQPSSEA